MNARELLNEIENVTGKKVEKKFVGLSTTGKPVFAGKGVKVVGWDNKKEQPKRFKDVPLNVGA